MDYKETVFLPKTEFPMKAGLPRKEPEILKIWEEINIYQKLREQRKGSEVTGIGDRKTAPDGINVINPAFDMTPPELIAGIITEKGVAKAPFEESIKKLFQAN